MWAAGSRFRGSNSARANGRTRRAALPRSLSDKGKWRGAHWRRARTGLRLEGTKHSAGRFVTFVYARKSVYVNHYYIYILDPGLGPRLHQDRWLRAVWPSRSASTATNGRSDNCRRRASASPRWTTAFFLRNKPATLQTTCDALDAAAIERFFARWQHQIPFPLTAHAARALPTSSRSCRPKSVSRRSSTAPSVAANSSKPSFARISISGAPIASNSCFPARFDAPPQDASPPTSSPKASTPACTSPTSTAASSSTSRRSAPCAPRPPSTIPTTSTSRRLSNLSYLRTLGDHINRRVLETERLAHDCGLAPAQLADLVQPTQTADGQPAPALKFGQPRVTALLNALCHFLWTADGLTNAQLRPLVASLLGTPYTTRQMGYDLRRLVRKRSDHTARSPEPLRPDALRAPRRPLPHQGPRPRPPVGAPGARPQFHRADTTTLAHHLQRARPRDRCHIAEAHLAA
jgi:hypothetical protein